MEWNFTCFKSEVHDNLRDFAQVLSSSSDNETDRSTFKALYPMYTLPIESLLQMETVRAHEELLADNELVIFDQCLGQAMFVSHEWCGRRHPDPDGEQVRVLQDALRHMNVAETIPVDVPSELVFGQAGMMTSELTTRPLFVWFDYFSCPQLVNSAAGVMNFDQQHAIQSIPAYVVMSRFFVILCPFVRQDGSNILLSKRTWAKRAWCRLERLASQLRVDHTGECTYTIEVHSTKHQYLTSQYEYCRDPVGEGNFTISADRTVAAAVLQSMFTKQMRWHLQRENFHRYRILLNMQNSQFKGLPLEPVMDIIPGLSEGMDGPKTTVYRRFMYQNGFADINARDEEGWSPMCYAALFGDPVILEALMLRGGNLNDKTTKPTPQLCMVADTSLAMICVYLSHHQALKFLLLNGADVHHKDTFGSTATHYACLNQNPEAVDLLSSFGGNPATMNALGYSPRLFSGGAGVGCGAIGVMDRLLPDASIEEISMALHLSILFGGASAEVVSALIEHGADVNYPLQQPMYFTTQLVFGFLALKHRWNQTAVSYYAKQHSSATPLMCSILCGSFEAAAVLVAAGARLDLKNGNGLTAQDLVAELGAPDFVQAAVHGHLDQCEVLVDGYFATQSIKF